MPLAPQITNTPSTITVNSDFTVTSVANVQENTTFYQGTAPAANAIGDIWFDTSNGNKQYRWDGSSWVAVQDTAIAAASSAAAAAQATANTALTSANGKNKVFYGSSTPTATSVGDLWFDGSSTNRPNQWNGSSWVPFGLGYLAVTSIDANAITVNKIQASQITSGIFVSTGGAASDINNNTTTINGGKITTGTITASQIATGTITATQIAAGTITTDKLVAGTLTGFTIQSAGAAFTISSTGSISGADTIGCNSLTASGTVSGSTVSATNSLSTKDFSLTGSVTSDFNLNSSSEIRNPYSYNNTTANAATVWVSSTGQYRRSTASSQRYKTDIVNLTDVPELNPKALYSLPVRAFRFKEEYLPATDDRAGVLVPGFIAEEMDAIYPAAVDYIEGNGVETWNDRMLVPALLSLIQDLNNRVKELEGN